MTRRPELLEQLRRRCRFPDDDQLTCVVSGGPDSLALLALAAASGREVTAIHVDHGLRPGSARDAEVVAGVAECVGATWRSVRVEVGPGADLEARARAARYAALPPGSLTGHTADDQAETVLLQLLRGAGPRGLGGMRPDRRPLLDLRRAETHALCDALGFEPVRDPSNLDPVHRRNRVRHEVLPLLDDVAGRDVVPVLTRAAELQRALDDLLGRLIEEVDPTDAAAIAELEPLVGGEVLRSWWRAHTGAEHPPDSAAIRRMLEVARGTIRATDVVDGWRLERTERRLRLVGPAACGPAANG